MADDTKPEAATALCPAEAARIARQYGVVVPEGQLVQRYAIGCRSEHRALSWREVSEARRRISRRQMRLARANSHEVAE